MFHQQEATELLKDRISLLREKFLLHRLSRQTLVQSGGGVVLDSLLIVSLVSSGSAAAGGLTADLGQIGAEAATNLFGSDVGKRVRNSPIN